MAGLVFEASMLVCWLSSEERECILKSLDFILSYFYIVLFFLIFFPGMLSLNLIIIIFIW